MMTRRQVFAAFGVLLAGMPARAAVQQQQPPSATVTLTIEGMT
jgi:hypothetical protein